MAGAKEVGPDSSTCCANCTRRRRGGGVCGQGKSKPDSTEAHKRKHTNCKTRTSTQQAQAHKHTTSNKNTHLVVQLQDLLKAVARAVRITGEGEHLLVFGLLVAKAKGGDQMIVVKVLQGVGQDLHDLLVRVQVARLVLDAAALLRDQLLCG